MLNATQPEILIIVIIIYTCIKINSFHNLLVIYSKQPWSKSRKQKIGQISKDFGIIFFKDYNNSKYICMFGRGFLIFLKVE